MKTNAATNYLLTTHYLLYRSDSYTEINEIAPTRYLLTTDYLLYLQVPPVHRDQGERGHLLLTDY